MLLEDLSDCCIENKKGIWDRITWLLEVTAGVKAGDVGVQIRVVAGKG